MNKLLLRSNEIIRWKNPVSHYLLSLVCMFGCLSLAHGKGAVKEGLVAYWSFDQATFNKKEIKDDFSGLVGEVIGNPELAKKADCKVNECLLLDGAKDYLKVKDSNPAKINRTWNQISLECWVFVNALDDSWNRIISLDDMPTNQNVVTLYYDDDDNRYNFWIRTPKAETDVAKHDIKGDIPTKKWLHLVGTYNGSTVILYVNGKQANKYEMKGGSLKKGGLILGIGDRSDGCDCDTIQAYLDEVRIYDRALTPAQVSNNFQAEGLAVEPSEKTLSLIWGELKKG